MPLSPACIKETGDKHQHQGFRRGAGYNDFVVFHLFHYFLAGQCGGKTLLFVGNFPYPPVGLPPHLHWSLGLVAIASQAHDEIKIRTGMILYTCILQG